LEREVFGKYIDPWEKKLQVEKQSLQKGSLAETEKIYLFLSSSVPDETVHAYISVIAGLDDPKVIPMMRGFVGGMADVKATIKYFSRILKKDLDCRDKRNPQLICPRYQVTIRLGSPLFQEFSISRVPAIVYVNDDNDPKNMVVKGDAGLEYLLERINREAKSPAIDNLIAKIRSGQ
jgi:hypothetical protein